MDPQVFQKLRARSAAIQVRWETLLRIEPVNGPLANPDALARLIPETLAEIFAAIEKTSPRGMSLQAIKANRLPTCNCGRNPYLAYFIAAEQAFVETLVLIQAEAAPKAENECDVAQTIHVVRTLGRGEIDLFCSICAHRCHDPKCRHRAGADSCAAKPEATASR